MSKLTRIAIVKNNEPTRIVLKSFRNQGDGTTNVDIEYDDVFLAEAKKILNKDTLSNTDLSNYVNGILDKATNGIDGYRVEREKYEA